MTDNDLVTQHLHNVLRNHNSRLGVMLWIDSSGQLQYSAYANTRVDSQSLRELAFAACDTAGTLMVGFSRGLNGKD